jgi:hypothetical protein
MKTVKILIEYRHTARRTWHPGDTPTLSSTLADDLVKNGVALIVGEGDTRMDLEIEEKDYIILHDEEE